MSAVAALHHAALDAAELAMSPAHEVAQAMADTLAAFVAEECLTPNQRHDLLTLTDALRLLADRLEVVS